MNPIALVREIAGDYTLRTVALGTGALGIVSGALGTFAVLRKQSLLGDTVSHAALPGIALAFLLTGSREPLVLILGAAVAGWLGMLFVMSIVKRTRIKQDSALGIVLAVFFGAGLVLLTMIRNLPTASKAGLDKFLFGQAAAILEKDVVIVAVLGGLALILLFGFWKEFKLLSFDPEFGASVGFPVHLLDILLTSLIVLAIVIGLQSVGVVLMSAMLVAPAAAARQWTNRLGMMVALSGFFGAVSGLSGALASSAMTRTPTGPMVVVFLSLVVVFSLFFAPNRGLVWNRIKKSRTRGRLRTEAVLLDLHALATQHSDETHYGHSVSAIEAMAPGYGVKASLESLERQGLAHRTGASQWALTRAGQEKAHSLLKERGQKP